MALNIDTNLRPRTRRWRTVIATCTVVTLAAIAAGFWLLRDPTTPLPEVTPARTVAVDAPQLNLFVLGDWGADTAAQRQVAAAMAARARLPDGRPDVVLLAGDNFYVRLSGINDPKWGSLFERMYEPSALPVPFYAVLGNHDYQHGKDAIELDYATRNPTSRWKLPARWYRLDLPAEQPMATILMLDSNYSALGADDWVRQRHWLEAELAKPRIGRWLIVCAHHPPFSNGKHGDDGRLKREWVPLLKSARVDFYLCGHDHDLEHLQIPGHDTAFVVSGGGGADTYALKRFDRGPFAARAYGFLHLTLGENSADAHLIDRAGRTVHSFSRLPLGAPAARPAAAGSGD